MKWIKFKYLDTSKSGKTKIYEVYDSQICIGEIRWYAKWRQYCLFPHSNTVWNSECLLEVTTFLASLMKKHKGG